MKRIIIAGASSHSGKTTVACGLLASLKRRGLDVIAYKTGPDYIDPEYLRRTQSKLRTYWKHGFIPMSNLIMTFETEADPLDVGLVKSLVRHYFL